MTRASPRPRASYAAKSCASWRADFDYYSRAADVAIHTLFYGPAGRAKASKSDLTQVEEFVRTFDLAEVNMAACWPTLQQYAPRAYALLARRVAPGPQVLTRTTTNQDARALTTRNPLLRLTRAQLEAEAIVATENVVTKNAYDAVALHTTAHELQSYSEAMAAPDAAKWKEAINKEIQSLEQNKTWRLVPLPPHKRALTSRWLMKVKHRADGSIERHKARLVVRGFQQTAGVYYEASFAPVVRLEALRAILAIVCIQDLEAHQIDVETAFLNETVKEDIYMEVPEGMASAATEGRVCKLEKSLYGLKQAPRAWHKALTQFLCGLGFEKLLCEACVYTRDRQGHKEVIAIYVDDLLIVAMTTSAVDEIKTAIAARFKSKDLGKLHFPLGLRVTRDRTKRKLWIAQDANAASIVQRFNMEHAHPVATPTVSGEKLQKARATEMSTEMRAKPFRQAVGTLMYLTIGSRPDLAYSITNVSSFLSNYSAAHWEAVKRLLRYVKGTPRHGLEYGGASVTLSAYSDSNYAGDEGDRKSVSGYVTYIGECAVTWSSRKQRIVATSTAEAEYIALAHCVRETLFLRQFLRELGHEQVEPTTVFEDNQACISIAENPAQHARTKHIDVRYHFVRERIERREIRLEYVKTNDNTADVFTKGLERELFNMHRRGMNVVEMK